MVTVETFFEIKTLSDKTVHFLRIIWKILRVICDIFCVLGVHT